MKFNKKFTLKNYCMMNKEKYGVLQSIKHRLNKKQRQKRKKEKSKFGAI